MDKETLDRLKDLRYCALQVCHAILEERMEMLGDYFIFKPSFYSPDRHTYYRTVYTQEALKLMHPKKLYLSTYRYDDDCRNYNDLLKSLGAARESVYPPPQKQMIVYTKTLALYPNRSIPDQWSIYAQAYFMMELEEAF